MRKAAPTALVFALCAATVALAGSVVSNLNIRETSGANTPATGSVSLYAKADGLLYSKDDAGTETQVSGGGGSAGFTIGLPPSAGVASVSSTTYPAFGTNATSGIPHLAFDGATQEAIQWHGVTLPASYDSAANVTVEITISSGTASQLTRWGLRVATVERAAISTAPGTLLATAVYRSGTTSGTAGTANTHAWTLSNADLDSAAAGDLLIIELARDAASAEDTSTVDVLVHSVRIFQ